MSTGTTRHVAKMDKRSKLTSDVPIYTVVHSFFDPENSLTLSNGHYLQTKCTEWVKRIGTTLKKVRSVPDGHMDKHGIFLVSNTIEDGGKSTKAQEDPAQAAKRGFGGGTHALTVGVV